MTIDPIVGEEEELISSLSSPCIFSQPVQTAKNSCKPTIDSSQYAKSTIQSKEQKEDAEIFRITVFYIVSFCALFAREIQAINRIVAYGARKKRKKKRLDFPPSFFETVDPSKPEKNPISHPKPPPKVLQTNISSEQKNLLEEMLETLANGSVFSLGWLSLKKAELEKIPVLESLKEMTLTEKGKQLIQKIRTRSTSIPNPAYKCRSNDPLKQKFFVCIWDEFCRYIQENLRIYDVNPNDADFTNFCKDFGVNKKTMAERFRHVSGKNQEGQGDLFTFLVQSKKNKK